MVKKRWLYNQIFLHTMQQPSHDEVREAMVRWIEEDPMPHFRKGCMAWLDEDLMPQVHTETKRMSAFGDASPKPSFTPFQRRRSARWR